MLDKKYNFIESEKKWQDFWQQNGVYKFDPKSNKPTFSIDTPPPTVSGELHIGHISGFTQADMIARFHRMQGKNLYYPLGFDNNGLPTELLVEKKKNIRAHTLPREEFTKIALDLVATYNQAYRDMMVRAGMSCDLGLGYNTIDNKSQKTSQKSFIELVKKGFAYREDKPSPWCCKCRTSVATAELEDKELESVFNYLNFRLVEGGEIPIATTRPEFLPACVGIFVNPEDERYNHLIGKKVKVPLFEENEVEIRADGKVGIDKGTGIVMCCTFGDQTDVEWWKEYHLELKQAIDDGGRMTEIAGKYAGMKSIEARQAIIADLKEQGYLFRQDPIVHAVKVHERCSEPIEFLSKKQWFIRTSTPELKEKWVELGNKLVWHPESMKVRYMAWVNNLNQDWSISRQRYFGVPFPVWYCKDCGKVILADIEDLPVNPLTTQPKHKCECGCGEFIPETDVMDTWATSSVTPQINCNWAEDEKGCVDKMPMNMRFCGRDIITTWSLRTIIKAYFHQDCLPWNELLVNGWVMANKGEKFSKSKSNAKTGLNELLGAYGADVIRYWCAIGAYGRDVMFSEDGFKDGFKLLNKIWNASKFVLSFLEDYKPHKPAKILPMDRYIMHKFNDAFKKTYAFYEGVEMGYAKNEIEKFFWNFCDNYIEIAKNRLYKPEVYGEDAKESAQWACYNVLLGMLKLFAITMPHITEEIYQAYFRQFENEISIHLTKLALVEVDDEANIIENGDKVVEIVARVRQFKGENKISLKTALKDITIKDEKFDFVKECEADIKAVSSAQEIKYETGAFDVVVGEAILDEQ
ncbi:MAG: valine--tRNA ligase [Clostridia bacterium]|nr:valine--tRNA ligase [Clostridia bacterium]